MLEKIKQSESIDTERDAIQDVLNKYWSGDIHVDIDKLVSDINNVAAWHTVDESYDIWFTDY